MTTANAGPIYRVLIRGLHKKSELVIMDPIGSVSKGEKGQGEKGQSFDLVVAGRKAGRKGSVI